MPAIFRAGWRDGLTALLLLAPTPLAAQASAYLPLDDPRLPALEYLITRGTVPDPSPMVRPFRIGDALDALARADTAPHSRDAALVRSLHDALTDSIGVDRWRAGGRAGFQSYTHARRDPLHPAGAAGARIYAQADLSAVFGPIVAVTRPTVEPRLIR
ncbi:MAG TPA: hypothetical protein VFL95_10905, partial [Gemmatimonadales bacterium]|nr:hypothetical protein [Gemmatimonadales bacterium]